MKIQNEDDGHDMHLCICHFVSFDHETQEAEAKGTGQRNLVTDLFTMGG